MFIIVNCGVQVDFLSQKKISTKLGVDLYGGAKIQTFTTEYSTSGTLLLAIDKYH